MGFIPGTQDWFKSLDEIQPGNRKKHKNHRDISEMEKRYLKNSMNIHDKILKKKKKTPNKPRSRTEFPQLDKGHLRKTDSYHHILLVKDSTLSP